MLPHFRFWHDAIRPLVLTTLAIFICLLAIIALALLVSPIIDHIASMQWDSVTVYQPIETHNFNSGFCGWSI